MKIFKLVVFFAASLPLISCKDVGFKQLEDPSGKASIKSAKEALHSIHLAIENYHAQRGTYPNVDEWQLFDTIQNYFVTPIDQSHLYRSDKQQSNYVAVGSRRNRIIYRYPSTVGNRAYTLYWIGKNGVDERGNGDDILEEAK